MAHILIIDSDPAALNARARAQGRLAAGDGYANALRQVRRDLEITIVAPYDGDAIPDLGAFDGVAFTGSGVEWNTDDARAEPLAVVMREVFSRGIPAIGSCNGMQLAASVLGGSSDASPNGREDGLALDVRLTEAGRVHPMMAGRRDGYAVPCVHRDEVVRLPDGAVLLAGNAHSPVQAFAYEQDGVRFWGMQYHPEYEPEDMARMLGPDGRATPGQVNDFNAAKADPVAAQRLGARPQELCPPHRMVEFRNWLASL